MACEASGHKSRRETRREEGAKVSATSPASAPAAPALAAAREAEVERLVDTYADLICRVSYTYLRSTADAEDICQTVLMKLMGLVGDGARRFESAEHEKAWIIRATINASKDVLKSAYRQRVVSMEENRVQGGGAAAIAPGDVSAESALPRPATSPSPEQALLEAESPVLAAVKTLPPLYREAIYLYYYEGYTARDIAAITGSSEAAVHTHLSRGRAKLRTMLKEDAR